MILPRTIILLLAGIVALAASPAQEERRILIPIGEPPTEETRLADALRSQPARDYEFNRASLRDVLRFLANDAGISYVAVPEAGDAENQLITFDIHASPFKALEVIAKANGVALFYEDGIWYLRPFNDKELVGRTYKLKYNSEEEVKYDAGAMDAPQTSTSGMGGTQSGSGTAPDLGLSLTGQTNVFKTDPKQLIDDIKALLGLPTNSYTGVLAADATVDAMNPLDPTAPSIQYPVPTGGGSSAAGEVGGPQVIWNSDSNTLYVVATRQQHRWVEGYINSTDRPQPLIAIEVKFFETTKDPSKQLGVDWAGTLANGFTLSATDLTAGPNGVLTIDQADSHQSQSGSLPPGSSPFDYQQAQKVTTASFAAPYGGVLRASTVAATLNAFLSDLDTSTISYPRVLTRNNREVVIRSVVNQPVLASTSSVTPGVGGTTTASVTYLPIGTIINVLPKVMTDGSIMLSVAVTISSIIAQTEIEGNSYPVASTRVYNAALEVSSGYTLAIGGLEEAFDASYKNGVPFLKDIPLLGYAFRSNSRSRQKKNLIIFITPTIVGYNAHYGITESPESTLPVQPGQPPPPPAFAPGGGLVGGEAALSGALAWLAWQERYFKEIIKESRTTTKTVDQINGILDTCKLLIIETETYRLNGASNASRLDADQAELDRLTESFRTILVQAKNNILTF